MLSFESSASIQPSLLDELTLYKQLLKGVASATNRLLTTQDYRQAVDEALAILGAAIQVDRIYIFETHSHPDNSEPAMSQRWEWTAPDIVPEIDNPDLQNLLYSESLPRWYRKLSNHHPIVGLVKDFPPEERCVLEPQGILSILVVPIFIQAQLWGFVGFDQCHSAHEWNETELETLRAMAGSLGGAIAQHRAEAKLQNLNHQLEATVEERTCALRQTNLELENTLESLKETQIQLIHAEKMTGLGQIVAGVAHEINNPATFIYSNLGHAQSYVTDLLSLVEAYQSEYPNSTPLIEQKLQTLDIDFLKNDCVMVINSMTQGVHRINRIVRSLHEFSRYNEAEYKCASIHNGLESTLGLLEYRLNPVENQPGILVERQYDLDIPDIMCYAGALNQAFLNIVSNAIDALEEKTHKEQDQRPNKIVITTKTLKHGKIRICIADNANGIAPEVRPKIFDPFFTAKPIGQGTGLGLSIAYQIVVKQHGGKLACQSAINEGTCMSIELPSDRY
ncbi:ATP-binding protein [cf. Phormidesmis sp. LEGE 11477]|uniref:GAF domain-containing sensor histidine kinase n=1 Tax=cf. Phormidesmis sp. LEGE 11477 TaxID=1828680 RepID=UPI00188295B2|nr:ATP-binding protein [cf. Phormidesmis sp. LEGE 11477]MBE9064424.1 GAF domain-containing protein [cf. Phormidesmis sp. LEGE 11477]